MFFLLAVLFAVIGVAPLVSAGIAQAIANGHGCALDEGSAHVCLVAGRDMGGLLYSMAVAGWLALLTIWLLMLAPVFGLIGLILWTQERKGAMR